MKTRINIVPNQISPPTLEKMWDIYQKYYHYSKEHFLTRAAKNTHFAFFYEGEQMVGFTGLRINEIEVEAKDRLLICFGQTVIEKTYRGKSYIPVVGAKLCWKYFRYLLGNRMYFWCDALTYKSYLVFAKTLEEFYPTYKMETPAVIKKVMDFIGQTHYTDAYCPDSGNVSKPVNYVSDPSVQVRAKDLSDPDIRFYTQANKEHENGHGLLTIAPVSWSNFVCLVKRYFAGKKPAPQPAAAPSFFSKTINNRLGNERPTSQRPAFTNPFEASIFPGQ